MVRGRVPLPTLLEVTPDTKGLYIVIPCGTELEVPGTRKTRREVDETTAPGDKFIEVTVVSSVTAVTSTSKGVCSGVVHVPVDGPEYVGEVVVGLRTRRRLEICRTHRGPTVSPVLVGGVLVDGLLGGRKGRLFRGGGGGVCWKGTTEESGGPPGLRSGGVSRGSPGRGKTPLRAPRVCGQKGCVVPVRIGVESRESPLWVPGPPDGFPVIITFEARYESGVGPVLVVGCFT